MSGRCCLALSHQRQHHCYRVYAGHNSVLIAPTELERDPTVWLTAVSQYRVRDTFCSYGVMEMCTRGLGSATTVLKQRGINLSSVRTCIVVAEERPRLQLMSSFTKVFATLGLSPRAVSTTFGCRVNTAMCLQVGVGVLCLINNHTCLLSLT